MPDEAKAKIDKLLKIIEDYTNWQSGRGLISHAKPGHGPCCTCQKCGYDYDMCVCDHNEIEIILNSDE